MDIFNQLPDSVLQWFAIFISIIIEALTFGLSGTILSVIIEVCITPDIV
ncbi:permease, partial [Streptococcus agalactiae]|nr:permease [Streptococcus agalactiae]